MGALEAGITGASGILGAGLGMLTRDWSDRKQLEQQKKLQKLGIEGSKEMGKFNQNLALETWDKTNFDAQRKQMEKAGLNVGLMYNGNAQGGATSAGAPVISAGEAPKGGGEVGMGMQLGTATAMQAAQIENIKADTQQKKVDTAKTAGVDTEQTIASTANLKADTANKEVNNAILEYQKDMAALDAKLKDETYVANWSSAWQGLQKLEAEVKTAQAQGNIDQATANEKIKQATLTTTNMQLQNALLKEQKGKTAQETQNLKKQIEVFAANIATMKQNAVSSGMQAEAAMKQAQNSAEGVAVQKQLADWQTSGNRVLMETGSDILKNVLGGAPRKK